MPLRQKTGNSRQATKAFTIVELLAVVTITGILAALLLPSLSAAKEKSQRAVCKSNIRQDIIALRMYGDDNQEILPTAADNQGQSHTIRISDITYSNFVAYLSDARTLDCPNISFGSTARHDANGYVIGYSYLGSAGLVTSEKSADGWVAPKKLSDPGTNEIMADANYWAKDSSKLKVAPHTASGPMTVNSSSFTTGLPGDRSVDIGAVGGNIGYLNGSVLWKTMGQMGTHQAASVGAVFGNW